MKGRFISIFALFIFGFNPNFFQTSIPQIEHKQIKASIGFDNQQYDVGRLTNRINELEEQGFVIKAQIQLPIFKLKIENSGGKPVQKEIGRTVIISFERIK